MILKGSERGGPTQLATHLLNTRDNDHVELHDLHGFVSDDLYGAFQEIQAISLGTKCRKFMFSLSLNPPGEEDVSVEVFEKAIEQIESRLGLSGLPRAIVFHEKQGPQGYRRHAHCVWSRIDGERMRAINISHYKRKLNDISRALYLEQGWQLPPGFQQKEDVDSLNYAHGEYQQAKRAKRNPKELKRIFVACWQRSDSRTAFASALKEHGLILAKGDRRGHVAVDAQGEVYAISRWVCVKAKEVRNVLGQPHDLPSVQEALEHFSQSATEQKTAHQSNRQPNATAIAKHAELSAKLDLRKNERYSVMTMQKQARIDLKQQQELRNISETKARSAKLPHGLRAMWSKLSGSYQELIKRNEVEVLNCKNRDRAEWQALVDVQVKENRHLNQDITNLRQQLHQLGADAGLEASFGLNLDPAQALIIPPDPEALTVKAKVQRDPEHILKFIIDKTETFTRNDVVRKLANYIDDPLKLGRAVDQVMRSDELVEVQDSSKSGIESSVQSSKYTTSATYSTREFQKLKAELLDGVSSLSQATGAFVSERNINSAIKSENRKLKNEIGASLSQEQETAIRQCLSSKRLVSVIGYAGAGKSTMLSAARHGWETQGYNVIGAALSGKAADGLEKASGIKSRTLASFEKSWSGGYNRLTSNDVLVIDEAGMISTRQMARFIKTIKKTGAKIVLVGDPEQLQPINAGTPFRDICNRVDPAQLTEIHRQQEDWQKQASLDFANLQTEKALKVYETHGYVVETPNTEAAIFALVEDYMADFELHGDSKSRLALAHRRKDVHAINQAIRSAIKSGGVLNDEVVYKTDHGKRAFAKGDRILFTKNDHSIGIRNGMLGTVQSTSEDDIKIKLDAVSGSSGSLEIRVNPKQYSTFEHGYATTIHKSQGVTVDNAYLLGSVTMNEHLTYVAMTRHKDAAFLYLDKLSYRKLMTSERNNGFVVKQQVQAYKIQTE